MFETRRGRLIALGCTVGIGAVLAYRTGSYEKVRARLYRIARTLGIYHDIASHGGELVSDLLKDLQEFLHSDSKDVPRSFCQLARLLSSEEAVELYASLARGAVRGAGGSPPGGSGGSGGAALADRFLELLFSERGESLVSVAVAMAARSSAQALCARCGEPRRRRLHRRGARRRGQRRGPAGDRRPGGEARDLCVHRGLCVLGGGHLL
uniref:Uncharacterized protein n=1 Tax=Tetraselmis sp. GSL018 TaxID=582737 RepID=A0A061SDK2_9CHLO